MTAYLTDDIDADEIAHGFAQGVFTAGKLYPANATTNAEPGGTALAKTHRALECMQAPGMPLMVTCEVTAPAVETLDAEAGVTATVHGPSPNGLISGRTREET